MFRRNLSWVELVMVALSFLSCTRSQKTTNQDFTVCEDVSPTAYYTSDASEFKISDGSGNSVIPVDNQITIKNVFSYKNSSAKNETIMGWKESTSSFSITISCFSSSGFDKCVQVSDGTLKSATLSVQDSQSLAGDKTMVISFDSLQGARSFSAVAKRDETSKVRFDLKEVKCSGPCVEHETATMAETCPTTCNFDCDNGVALSYTTDSCLLLTSDFVTHYYSKQPDCGVNSISVPEDIAQFTETIPSS